MSIKYKIIGIIVLALTSYAFGRWSAPEKIKEVVKEVEVEKKTSSKDTATDKDTHKKTTTTETVNPDGTKTTTTETVEDTSTKRNTAANETDDTTKTSESYKEITNSTARVSILALYGIPLTGGTPVYGGSISRPVLGPITIGVWGNSMGVAGLGMGLTF